MFSINVCKTCRKASGFLLIFTPCGPYQRCGLATVLKKYFFYKKIIVFGGVFIYNASTINIKWGKGCDRNE